MGEISVQPEHGIIAQVVVSRQISGSGYRLYEPRHRDPQLAEGFDRIVQVSLASLQQFRAAAQHVFRIIGDLIV